MNNDMAGNSSNKRMKLTTTRVTLVGAVGKLAAKVIAGVTPGSSPEVDMIGASPSGTDKLGVQEPLCSVEDRTCSTQEKIPCTNSCEQKLVDYSGRSEGNSDDIPEDSPSVDAPRRIHARRDITAPVAASTGVDHTFPEESPNLDSPRSVSAALVAESTRIDHTATSNTPLAEEWLDKTLRDTKVQDKIRSLQSGVCAKLVAALSDRQTAERICANLELLKRDSSRASSSSADATQCDGLVLDLAWPGTSYNAVACGGGFEVLRALERRSEADNSMPRVRIGRLVGSSGGACSAVLAAVDADRSSNALLQAYMAWAKSELSTGISGVRQTWRVSEFWREMYILLMDNPGRVRDPSSTDSVGECGGFAGVRGRVHIACARLGLQGMKRFVVHDFVSSGQVAAAGVASGEASIHGLVRGISMENIKTEYGNMMDGGKVTWIPCDLQYEQFQAEAACKNGEDTLESPRVLVYHNTFYDSNPVDMAYLDIEKVERLFNNGVDCMLRFLTAEPPSPDDRAAGILLKAEPIARLGGVAALRDDAAVKKLARDWSVKMFVAGVDEVKWLSGGKEMEAVQKNMFEYFMEN